MNRNKLKNFSLKQLILALTGGAITTIGAYFLYKYFKGNKIDSNNKLRLLTLTEDEAREREKIKNIDYSLYLQFNPDISKSDKYSGTVVVKFDLDSIDNNLFIDYAGYIVSLMINGKKVSIVKDGERLILKKEHLSKSNLLIISFENYYSHINKGLTYFHEKSNSKSYVYTNIEPCYAHLVFPCFNQPSLKATVNFVAGTMNDWSVHSSGELETVSKSNKETSELKSKLNGLGFFIPEILDNYILHHFKSTEKIPIYLFGLFAGHFSLIHSLNNEKSQNVNVFIRKEIENDENNYSLLATTVSKGYELFKANLGSEISNKPITVCFVPNLDTKSVPCSRLLILDESLLTVKSSSLYNKNLLHLHLLATTAQQWFGVAVNPHWFDDIWISKGLACFLGFHFLKQISESVSILNVRILSNIVNYVKVGLYIQLKNKNLLKKIYIIKIIH